MVRAARLITEEPVPHRPAALFLEGYERGSVMPKLSLYVQIKLGLVRVHQRSPLEHRFWDKVDKRGPLHPTLGRCWVWNGAKNRQGYGYLSVAKHATRAHRFSWVLHNSPIPKSLQVCHHCDRPLCVNPSHLFLGTNDDNSADKVSKGRQARAALQGDANGSRTHPERLARGEAHGQAKLTAEQVLYIRRTYRRGFNGCGCGALAKELGVGETTIRRVVQRGRWRHVGE
jgi:hypothetical protein